MIDLTTQAEGGRFMDRWGCFYTAGVLNPIELEIRRKLETRERWMIGGMFLELSIPDPRSEGAMKPAVSLCNYKHHDFHWPTYKPERPGWDEVANPEFHFNVNDLSEAITAAAGMFDITELHSDYFVQRIAAQYGNHYVLVVKELGRTFIVNPDPRLTGKPNYDPIPVLLAA